MKKRTVYVIHCFTDTFIYDLSPSDFSVEGVFESRDDAEAKLKKLKEADAKHRRKKANDGVENEYWIRESTFTPQQQRKKDT